MALGGKVHDRGRLELIDQPPDQCRIGAGAVTGEIQGARMTDACIEVIRVTLETQCEGIARGREILLALGTHPVDEVDMGTLPQRLQGRGFSFRYPTIDTALKAIIDAR